MEKSEAGHDIITRSEVYHGDATASILSGTAPVARPDTPTDSKMSHGEETDLMLSGTESKGEVGDSTSDVAHTPKSAKTKFEKHWFKLWGIKILILSSMVAFLTVLAWWIAEAVRYRSDSISPVTIGGSLTYIQAKAIDFFCGTVLAPGLMVSLDFLWFTNARTSVAHERHNVKGVPLPSLIEASITSAGGFDYFKLRNFMRGRTWRLFLLGLLFLLSGLANSMFANFIAYQAFTTVVADGQNATLRLMSNAYVDSSGFDAFGLEGGNLAETQFTVSQQADIANQMAALLTGLNFESAIARLDGATYIGTNATAASLNALNHKIVGLKNVPGFRLSLDCQPGQMNEFFGTQLGETIFVFEMYLDCPINQPPKCQGLFQALLPGIISIGSATADNDEYTYVGFTLDSTRAVLGYLDSFNDTQYALNSSYGPVYPAAFNMPEFQGTKTIMTTWAVTCSIVRQEGFLNYIREPGQAWTISESRFSSEVKTVKSELAHWQTTLNYQAPLSTIPGLGPSLATTAGNAFGDARAANYTVYALNYLYASAEAQRITYEVAAKGNSSSQPEYLYNVSATTSLQQYQITYIPLLLFLGLLSTLGATTITGAMMLHTWNSRSTQTMREMDALRLLVDSVAGLQESASIMAEAGKLDKAALEKWAAKFSVRYSESLEGENVVMRLSRSELLKDVEETQGLVF